MKYLLVLLFSTLCFSQPKIYEYETFDKRTPDGWELINIPGEVHINNETKEIVIVNQNAYIIYNWTSKQQFIRKWSYLYRLTDWRNKEITMKIDYFDGSNDLELYYYSDEPGMKYFRLCLTLCKE
jgi:acyl-ACP thioesterase